ncbi:hypothetical protein PILCRDRAFT_222345 [Piloderma croceum F 1598]|uniref:Uncharacterized protein n=1 Tax=Piloderma croceum (strain F 1598) TaxID=765440 RepID=A0A0C3GCD2_PILCF|nr:hypothetical protein PILCRDRAFT_222345 [Piloderma croceum F 1598]
MPHLQDHGHGLIWIMLKVKTATGWRPRRFACNPTSETGLTHRFVNVGSRLL